MKHLAFSGGGMKGYCYVGVLQYLEENNMIKDIKKLSGTSIGSFIIFLIVLGYTSKEIKNLSINMDFSLLENFKLANLTDYGIDNGEKIDIFLNFFLKKKKYKQNITFKELYDKTKVHIYMNCCDISNDEEKVFDYINTPDTSVVFACKTSCSIPFLISLSHERYIDGCFIKNLPIEVLPVEDTIGFYFYMDKIEKIIDTFPSYINRVIACSLNKGNNLEIYKYESLGYKLIPIKTTTSALNFGISKEEKILNIEYGYKACELYLKK